MAGTTSKRKTPKTLKNVGGRPRVMEDPVPWTGTVEREQRDWIAACCKDLDISESQFMRDLLDAAMKRAPTRVRKRP